jgi:hypothetical protein
MKTFFYRYWGLYYLSFFLLLGLLIYALLWHPIPTSYTTTIKALNQKLEECRNSQATLKTVNAHKEGIKPDNKINCDASVKSGGHGVTNTQHELGNNSGTVMIDYDMQQVPDEIKVYYDNAIVAQSTGLVSGIGRLQFIYNAITGKPSFCTVMVSAPEKYTQWEYLLNCPQQ